MRLAIVAILCLYACAGKRISDVDAPAAAASDVPGKPWTVPPGVVVTAAERGASEIDGLYPSVEAGDRRCCWIAPHARLAVSAPRGARTLHIDVLVPDYPFFERYPPVLTVSAGTHSERFAPLTRGVHRLSVDGVRSADEAVGSLAVALSVERAFVPAREAVNADTRRLGIIVLRVAVDDAEQ